MRASRGQGDPASALHPGAGPRTAAALPRVRCEGEGGGVGEVGGRLEKGRTAGLQHSAPPLPLGQLSGASSRSIGRRSFKGGNSLADQARLCPMFDQRQQFAYPKWLREVPVASAREYLHLVSGHGKRSNRNDR